MASGPWPFFNTVSVCSLDSTGQLEETDRKYRQADKQTKNRIGQRVLAVQAKECHKEQYIFTKGAN